MSLRLRFIGSGSSGNAALVRAGRRAILLDAGVAPRRLEAACREEGVDPAALDGILLSHEHSDHTGGAAVFSNRHGVAIHCSDAVDEALARSGAALARREPINGRVDFGAMTVTPFPVPHDAPNLGFRVEAGGVAVGIATDLGSVTPRVVEGLRDCDALCIETNYDPERLETGPYPPWLKRRIASPTGHLANRDGAGLAAAAAGPATRRVVLLHLSERNNTPGLARDETIAALARAGRWNVRVDVAGRRGTHRPLEI